VSSLLALIALPLIVALTLFAPTDCGCALDVHGGEPLHPVFDHPHPDAPAEADGLTAPLNGQFLLQSAHALAAGGSASATGEVPPLRSVVPQPLQLVGRLTRWSTLTPESVSIAPQEPPPELA
jgi:hypothetical protein